MHADEIVDRLTAGLDRMDDEGLSADLAQEATRRLRRRRRTRRVTATGGVLSALLVAVLATSALVGDDPQAVVLQRPPATAAATPTPQAPTSPAPTATPDLDVTRPTPTPPPDEDQQPLGRAPDLLLSNGNAIGIRTAAGELLETFIVVPEEQIERHLGTVAVRPGTDPADPTFAYVDANETGQSVVVSDVGPDGRSDQPLDARVDFVNGRSLLSASPVWSPSGDVLAWLSHDAAGNPVISTAADDGQGGLTEVASSPLPIPAEAAEALGDRTYRLIGWEAADDADGGPADRLLIQAAHPQGVPAATVLYRVGITANGIIIDLEGADVDRVGGDPVTGRPVVDRTGVGEDDWALSGTPTCDGAGCPAQDHAGYVLRRGQEVVQLSGDLDQGADATVPTLVAAGEDVIVLSADPQTFEPVAFRVQPDGAFDGLGYDAISVSPIPTG